MSFHLIKWRISVIGWMNPTHTGKSSMHVQNTLICVTLISKNGVYVGRVKSALERFGSAKHFLTKNICLVKISLAVTVLKLST